MWFLFRVIKSSYQNPSLGTESLRRLKISRQACGQKLFYSRLADIYVWPRRSPLKKMDRGKASQVLRDLLHSTCNNAGADYWKWSRVANVVMLSKFRWHIWAYRVVFWRKGICAEVKFIQDKFFCQIRAGQEFFWIAIYCYQIVGKKMSDFSSYAILQNLIQRLALLSCQDHIHDL